MKLFTNGARVLKTAFQNIFRNMWLSIATVIVLVMALVSVNLLVGINALLQNAVGILEDKIDVTVFFKEDANEALVTQARFFVEDLPQVKRVELVQANDALEQFKERHGDDSSILEALGELDGNPLGATLRIVARNPSDYPFIIETLKNPQFADAIESRSYDDHADAIANVERIAEHSRAIGGTLIAIFVLIGILIVYNTIRVAIYTQREEIGIMRLVGASSMYVRAPFVVQGIMLTLAAMLITAGLVIAGVLWIEPALVTLYDGTNPGLGMYFVRHWPILALVEGGALALLIGFTSWLAAGKYLKR